MKLRYVFPLVLAAAIGGGAAGHFRPELESAAKYCPLLEFRSDCWGAVREIEKTGRNYQMIADAMQDVCQYQYEAGYSYGREIFSDHLREIEAGWFAEAVKHKSDKDILRLGPKLRIKTKAGDVEFLDIGYLCHSIDIKVHRYKGKLAKMGWHVVDVGYYEGGQSILVSPVTGEQISTFDFLLESPSALRLVAHTSEEAEGGGLEIFRVEGEKLVVELNTGRAIGEPPLELNGSIVEVIGWIDDETLAVLANTNHQITLVRRAGRWQVETQVFPPLGR